MGILQAMQSPADIWSTHKEEKMKRDRAQKEKAASNDEFFAWLRARREESAAEFQEKRRIEQEGLRAEAKPLKPLPELPPTLIRGEPHDSGAPALINPTPAPREKTGTGGIVGDRGIFGLGLIRRFRLF